MLALFAIYFNAGICELYSVSNFDGRLLGVTYHAIAKILLLPLDARRCLFDGN